MGQSSSPSFAVARRGSPAAPLDVLLCRNGIVESVHRVHAAVTDQQGRLLMGAGDPFRPSFGRSALKPLQASLLILTGAAEQNQLQERQLAIACASHCGSVTHARAAFHILWNAGLSADLLQCPVPAGATSPLQHNCSGKHAAFLTICKRMDWPLATYMDPQHPLQREVLQRPCRTAAPACSGVSPGHRRLWRPDGATATGPVGSGVCCAQWFRCP